jgi:hypothetical protein
MGASREDSAADGMSSALDIENVYVGGIRLISRRNACNSPLPSAAGASRRAAHGLDRERVRRGPGDDLGSVVAEICRV